MFARQGSHSPGSLPVLPPGFHLEWGFLAWPPAIGVCKAEEENPVSAPFNPFPPAVLGSLVLFLFPSLVSFLSPCSSPTSLPSVRFPAVSLLSWTPFPTRILSGFIKRGEGGTQ